jgi:uncharacterized protein
VTKEGKPNAPARLALWAIAGYRSARANQISPCRFTPSCSEYAHEAIVERGVCVGTALAAWRIMRCNPIGGHGVDLVPLKSGAKR